MAKLGDEGDTMLDSEWNKVEFKVDHEFEFDLIIYCHLDVAFLHMGSLILPFVYPFEVLWS